MEDTKGLSRRGRIRTRTRCRGVAVALTIGLGVIAALAPGPAIAEDARPAEELVARARVAAGRDEHDEAVSAALAAIAREPERADGLALFLGHQLTWADRPAEAVPWYRRHLARHPGDDEGRLGLARALSWIDDLDGASLVYAEILRSDPDQLDAQLGLARMQAWGGHDGAAAREYARAREIDPSSSDAALGEAGAENRRGMHRLAERRLLDFAAAHGDDAAVRVELARARWWMGESDHALATLDGANDAGATDLRGAIRRDRRWRLEAFASRWIDVDEQETRTVGVRAEREHARGLASSLEAAHSAVDEPGIEEIASIRFVAGGAWRADRRFSLHALITGENVGGGLSDGDSLDAGAGEIRLGRDVKGWRSRWDSWATWTPRDRTRIDAGWGRTAVETPRARVRDVHADVLSLAAEQRLRERLVLRAKVARAGLSDDNVRVSFETEGRYGPVPVTRRARAQVDAGFLRYGFDDTPDHGYYSPSTYDAFFGAGHLEITLGRQVTVVGDLRLSSEREESLDRFGVASGGGELRWDPDGPIQVAVFARKSTSRFDTSAGYGTRGVGVAVRITP